MTLEELLQANRALIETIKGFRDQIANLQDDIRECQKEKEDIHEQIFAKMMELGFPVAYDRNWSYD